MVVRIVLVFAAALASRALSGASAFTPSGLVVARPERAEVRGMDPGWVLDRAVRGRAVGVA